MGTLWDLLRDNPILLFVLLAWVAGAVGNVLRSQKKAKEQAAPRRASRTPSDTAAPSAAGKRAPSSPRPVASAPPPAPAAGQGSKSADEVAAEMRRILGLDVEVTPVETRPTPPIQREPVRKPPAPERPPTPLSPTVASQSLDLHIDPHVGESIATRSAPRSGRVGTHDREWGTLGGRRRDTVVALVQDDADRLIDLSDLKRTLLGAEILGPPLALREWDQRMF